MKRITNIIRGGCIALLTVFAGASYAAPSIKGPITIVVPYAAGGPTDIIARIVAAGLAEKLKVDVIVDNKAGASGTIGASTVARAAPDGRTLLVNSSIHEVLPSISSKLPYDTASAFTPLARLVDVPLVLAVTTSLPVHSVKELTKYIKAHPGTVNAGNPGVGSSDQLATALYRMRVGVEIEDIAYRGSAPAIVDLIGGQVQMMFDAGPSIYPHVKSGKLRGLATTGQKRSAIAPELPTMQEAGVPDYALVNWYGMWAPAGLTPEVENQLLDALRSILNDRDIRRQLANLGAEATDVLGKDFKRFAEQEREKLGNIAKTAGIKMN